MISFRQSMSLFSGVSLLLLMVLYYIEYGLNQSPCSLCLLQRYVLWAIFGVAFMAVLLSPKQVISKMSLTAGLFVFSGLGFMFAVRQIWIQHLPREAVPNCVADLERLLKFQPLWEVLKTVMAGGGECREVSFKILGFSLAEAAVLLFAGYMFYTLVLLFLEQKRRI